MTEEEFEAAADTKFDKMDTHGDDFLTVAEWKAGRDNAHKSSGK